MSQGNGASVGVHLGHVQAQLANTVDALAGKGLVQFEDADVALLDAAVFVEVPDGENRRDTHLVRSVTGHLRAGEACNRLQSMGVCPRPTSEDGGGCTVGDLGPVQVSLSSFVRYKGMGVHTSFQPCWIRPPEQT